MSRHRRRRGAEDAARDRRGGGSASAFHCNVADPESVTAAVAAVASSLGAPNVLCNIAGVGDFANTTELPFDEWQRVIGVNLTGTFLMCQAMLPHILENGGNIVNTASNAGLQGLAYCGGVLRVEGRRRAAHPRAGDRVLEAGHPRERGRARRRRHPALAWLHDARRRRHVDFMAKMMAPLGMAEPDDLASLFAYIASDEARYMTGAIVSMDAGLTT